MLTLEIEEVNGLVNLVVKDGEIEDGTVDANMVLQMLKLQLLTTVLILILIMVLEYVKDGLLMDGTVVH